MMICHCKTYRSIPHCPYCTLLFAFSRYLALKILPASDSAEEDAADPSPPEEVEAVDCCDAMIVMLDGALSKWMMDAVLELWICQQQCCAVRSALAGCLLVKYSNRQKRSCQVQQRKKEGKLFGTRKVLNDFGRANIEERWNLHDVFGTFGRGINQIDRF